MRIFAVRPSVDMVRMTRFLIMLLYVVDTSPSICGILSREEIGRTVFAFDTPGYAATH